MTVLPHAMATGDSFLITAKAWDRALRQAEFDGPATDSAPFHSTTCSTLLPQLGQRPSRLQQGFHAREHFGPALRTRGVAEGGEKQWT